ERRLSALLDLHERRQVFLDDGHAGELRFDGVALRAERGESLALARDRVLNRLLANLEPVVGGIGCGAYVLRGFGVRAPGERIREPPDLAAERPDRGVQLLVARAGGRGPSARLLQLRFYPRGFARRRVGAQALELRAQPHDLGMVRAVARGRSGIVGLEQAQLLLRAEDAAAVGAQHEGIEARRR